MKGLERSWIRHFGVPKYLRVDSAKGWEARVVRDWCADKGIILEVAPAEAHNWLGVVERKHQVVRRSLELYMDELGGATLSSIEGGMHLRPTKDQSDVFHQRLFSSTMGLGTNTSTRTIPES